MAPASAAFTIDPLYEGNTGPLTTPPVHVTAGPHRVAAAFVAKADGPVEDSVRLVEQTILDVSVGLHPGMTTLPHLMTTTDRRPAHDGRCLRHAEPPAHPDVPSGEPGRGTGLRHGASPRRWPGAPSAARRPLPTSTR